MKIHPLLKASLISALLWPGAVAPQAGTPLPHWILYGQAVDEFGWPYCRDASVELHVNGRLFKSYTINGSINPGMNFIFRLPMDSGSGNRYDTSAGRPGDTYQVVLVANGETRSTLQSNVLPSVGQSGDVQRLNVTAGTDSDQDGLPDEWERWILDHSLDPSITTLLDVKPQDDFDGDGVSNLDEYRAGTDPAWENDYFFIEQFQLAANGRLAMSFLTVPGKTYRLQTAQTPLSEGQPVWKSCAFAKSPTGTLQSDSFEGSGFYVTIYVEPSADMEIFRIAVE